MNNLSQISLKILIKVGLMKMHSQVLPKSREADGPVLRAASTISCFSGPIFDPIILADGPCLSVAQGPNLDIEAWDYPKHVLGFAQVVRFIA